MNTISVIFPQKGLPSENKLCPMYNVEDVGSQGQDPSITRFFSFLNETDRALLILSALIG